MDFSGIFSRIWQAQLEVAVPSFDPVPLTPIVSDLFFVDGGNSSLFSSALFDLSFIRVARVLYSKGSLSSIVKEEFYCLSIPDAGRFKVFLYPSRANVLTDSFFQPTVIDADSLGVVAQKVRRYAELSVCALTSGPCILDGSLDFSDSNEESLIRALRNTVALSKSSDKRELSCMCAEGVWFARLDNFYATKLHPKSRYVFRADIKGDPTFLLSALVPNSKDPVFLGYPFGLIQADKFARVSNQDSDYLKTKIASQAGNVSHLLFSDAHSILDNISF